MCRLVVAAGDPCQLAPVVANPSVVTGGAPGLCRSLFDRLLAAGCPATLLPRQYRCHPQACLFLTCNLPVIFAVCRRQIGLQRSPQRWEKVLKHATAIGQLPESSGIEILLCVYEDRHFPHHRKRMPAAPPDLGLYPPSPHHPATRLPFELRMSSRMHSTRGGKPGPSLGRLQPATLESSFRDGVEGVKWWECR